MSGQSVIEVVIVGGGQAGICLSHFLQQRRISHVVLERDRPFSAWYHRWDGLRANTPNWMNTLPGIDQAIFPGSNAAGFATKQELTDYFESYLRATRPPITNGVEVERIVHAETGHWRLTTNGRNFESKNVVVCTGPMSEPRVPAEAAEIPDHVHQMHSIDYRRPDSIHARTVLVVGSGSSGTQICKELGASGRFEQVFLAQSKVLVLPCHVFGIQVHRFLHAFGLFDIRTTSWLGKLMYSGLEQKGDPIVSPTPRDLARTYNVKLLGRFTGADGDSLLFTDGQAIDGRGLTILWCTGFGYDYSWIEVEGRERAFDKHGYPIHTRGVVTGARGLYFLGLRYQHTVASHDIYGVGRDARYLAEYISANSPG